jgi:hypothetical protein
VPPAPAGVLKRFPLANIGQMMCRCRGAGRTRTSAQGLFTLHSPQNKLSAGGAWKAYYEKWECVTRERLDPRMRELAR